MIRRSAPDCLPDSHLWHEGAVHHRRGIHTRWKARRSHYLPRHPTANLGPFIETNYPLRRMSLDSHPFPGRLGPFIEMSCQPRRTYRGSRPFPGKLGQCRPRLSRSARCQRGLCQSVLYQNGLWWNVKQFGLFPVRMSRFRMKRQLLARIIQMRPVQTDGHRC